MVRFQLNINLKNSTGNNQKQRPRWIPEVATYDFHSANKEDLKKALGDINWKEQLGPASNIQNYNRRLAEGIVAAAKEAKVPKFKDRTNIRKKDEDPTLTAMTQIHNKLNGDLQNTELKTKVKENKTKELHELNKAIQDRIEENLEKEEIQIASGVKTNPKAFFCVCQSKYQSQVISRTTQIRKAFSQWAQKDG